MMYRTFGHFDFQISAMLGQYVEKWQFRQGRMMIGGLGSRVIFFFETLIQSNSIAFNVATMAAIFGTTVVFIKKNSKVALFLLVAMLFETLWFMAIGSTFRFVVMVIPYFVLLVVFVISEFLMMDKLKKIILITFILFIIIESFFSINTFLLPRSFGSKEFAYAAINMETQNFGYNQINEYLDKLLKNKVSGAFGKPEYQFMVDLHNKAIGKAKKNNYESYPLMVIYDKNLNFLSTLWTFQRRLMYYGWPMMSDKAFYDITGGSWEKYYQKQGIKHFIYITGIENKDFNVGQIYAPYKPKIEQTPLEKHLHDEGIKYQYIKNFKGDNAFKLYEF